MDRIRQFSALIAVTEVMAALLACITLSVVIGFVLTLLLAPPPTFRAEIDLVRRGDVPAEVILRHVDRLGLAPHSTLAEDDGRTFLVLSGMPSPHFSREALFDALAAAGCRPGDVSTRPEIKIGELLQKIAKPYLSLQALVFFLAGALLMRIRLRRPSSEDRRGYWRAALLGLGAGLASFTISAALGALIKLLGVPLHEQEWILDLLHDRDTMVGLIPWFVLIVPISEEVFFRGYVFRLLSQNAGSSTGFILSSLMFALVHFNLTGILVYMCIGLVLAWVYKATNNILAPIAGHIVHNTIVLSFLLMAPPV